MNMEKLTETITNLVKKLPNDQDLGKQYRKITTLEKDEIDEFCKKYPNDIELGRFLRKKIYN
jgi:hypothetical protein